MARKKNTYFKENEFEDWLKNEATRWSDLTSVSSYKSGVGSMINWVNGNKKLWKTTGGTPVKDFNWYLKNINSNEDRETFFSAVLNIIQKGINIGIGNKSTLQNSKSHLSAYEEFFRNKPFPDKSLSPSQRKMLRQNSSCATYTSDELIDEFKERILSQDRISKSKKVMFPIRLIRKLWKNESEEWASKVSENIFIIVKDKNNNISETIIKNIDKLRIKNGKVIITIKNDANEYIMCTSYSDPYERIKKVGDQIQFIKRRSIILAYDSKTPLNDFIIDKNKNIKDVTDKKILFWHVKTVKAKNLEDIAIDHDIPISQVLIEKAKQLSYLQEISKVYRDLSNNYNIKISAMEANKFCKMVDSDSDGIDRIKKCYNNNGDFPKQAMKEIGDCKLVLMGKKDNSLKSDN